MFLVVTCNILIAGLVGIHWLTMYNHKGFRLRNSPANYLVKSCLALCNCRSIFKHKYMYHHDMVAVAFPQHIDSDGNTRTSTGLPIDLNCHIAVCYVCISHVLVGLGLCHDMLKTEAPFSNILWCFRLGCSVSTLVTGLHLGKIKYSRGRRMLVDRLLFIHGSSAPFLIQINL